MSSGATDEFSLRVSVATLSRIVFKHPQEGYTMLALERMATLLKEDGKQTVVVRAQPFGGAVRLRSVGALRQVIGEIRFDSERSRAEQDFRLQIRSSDWEAVKDFCIRHLQDPGSTILETSPAREIAEEFADSLGIEVAAAQYVVNPTRLVIQNEPAITGNVRASGRRTARIYSTFEVRIEDPDLVTALLSNSDRYSDQDLQGLALREARSGGKGRANAILALPVDDLTDTYTSMSPEKRIFPIIFRGHHLAGNVPAVLENVVVPQYQRL